MRVKSLGQNVAEFYTRRFRGNVGLLVPRLECGCLLCGSLDESGGKHSGWGLIEDVL